MLKGAAQIRCEERLLRIYGPGQPWQLGDRGLQIRQVWDGSAIFLIGSAENQIFFIATEGQHGELQALRQELAHVTKECDGIQRARGGLQDFVKQSPAFRLRTGSVKQGHVIQGNRSALHQGLVELQLFLREVMRLRGVDNDHTIQPLTLTEGQHGHAPYPHLGVHLAHLRGHTRIVHQIRDHQLPITADSGDEIPKKRQVKHIGLEGLGTDMALPARQDV